MPYVSLVLGPFRGTPLGEPLPAFSGARACLYFLLSLLSLLPTFSMLLLSLVLRSTFYFF